MNPIFTALFVFSSVQLISSIKFDALREAKCRLTCRMKIVETIPYNVSFPGQFVPESTFSAWTRIIKGAKNEIDIVAYKSSLQASYVLEGDELALFQNEGNSLFNLLEQKSSAVPIKLIDRSSGKQPDQNLDGDAMQSRGTIERRPLDVGALVGRGINHMKMMVVDDMHVYIGSANLDWRSLNQKMEIGVLFENCPCMGADARSLFDSLWRAAGGHGIALPIRPQFASYNIDNQFSMNVTNAVNKTDVFISGNPLALLDYGRTPDIEGVLYVIRSAQKYLYMHIMDYFPIDLYSGVQGYWALIDASLRDAILRGVDVKIIGSPVHFESIGVRFLKSLQDLDAMNDPEIPVHTNVEVKIFVVPPLNVSWAINQHRRTHNKFIVTEQRAIIGTSNFAADYFGGTTGASVVVTQQGGEKYFIEDLRAIFWRDFYSEYSHPVNEYYHKCVLQKEANFCQPKSQQDVEKILKMKGEKEGLDSNMVPISDVSTSNQGETDISTSKTKKTSIYLTLIASVIVVLCSL